MRLSRRCVLTAVNYYARNDPLVKLDRRAAELMKLTNDSNFQEVISSNTIALLQYTARRCYRCVFVTFVAMDCCWCGIWTVTAVDF